MPELERQYKKLKNYEDFINLLKDEYNQLPANQKSKKKKKKPKNKQLIEFDFPTFDPLMWVSQKNQILRRELFKKFYGKAKHREDDPFRLNRTDDAIDCFRTLLSEFHEVFDTFSKPHMIIPEWQKAGVPIEYCKCLVH